MTLDAEDIEAIARRVAELITERLGEPAARLVDAAHVAALLGVERDWVYAHADQLGAIRLGGPKGRLRFDLTTVTAHADRTADVSARRPHARARAHAATVDLQLDRRTTYTQPRRPTTTKVAGRRANAPGRDTGRDKPPMQDQRTSGRVS